MPDDIAQKIIEDQKQMLSTMYDRTHTYNSIILVIGYAGFFGLWTLIKDHISSRQALWGALLISISLIALIFFETYKMIYSSWLILTWQKELIEVRPGQTYDFIERWNVFKAKLNTANLWHIRIWVVQLCIVIPTALAAAGIMLWAFISQLFKLYCTKG